MLSVSESKKRQFTIFAKALASTYATLSLVSPSLNVDVPTVMCILIFGSFGFIYKTYSNTIRTTCIQSKVIAATLSLFTVLGENLLGWAYDHRSSGGLICLLFIYWGLFVIFELLLNAMYFHLSNIKSCSFHKRDIANKHVKKVFLISFSLLWCVYFCFFMNQYPGSLSCDSPAQLRQAMGDMPYENANPLINTLVLTICVKLGLFIGNSVNCGIALYTLFQFTLVALIFAYTITVLYKTGANRWIIVFSQLFFNCMPYNIFYAIGMWKDTFFAIFFLASIAYFYECLYLSASSGVQSVSLYRKIILFVLILISSLSRNSGWSSLLTFGIVLLIYAIKNKLQLVIALARLVISGVLCSLILVSVIYPFFGILDNGGIEVGLSVPLQQIARVVAYNKDFSEEDYQMINDILPADQIKDLYDPTISDPIKFSVNREPLKENLRNYAKLWVNLGLKNPKSYLDAYIDLTKCYWYPDETGWTWDTRIFENPYGVTRTPLLFPQIDIEQIFYVQCHKQDVLYTSSIILWIAIVMFGFSSLSKNKLGSIMFVPLFAVYIGLMITSPVALFRYTYGVVVCLPLIISIPFINIDSFDTHE